MKRICFMLFIMLYMCAPFKSAHGFHEVALHGGSGITEGYVESYGTAASAVHHHTVWLYTRADCGSISWTLGEKTHSEPLECGTAAGFIGVPEGVHHVVIEGCGKRIAAYLGVKKDLHLMLEPSDLHADGRCDDGGSPASGGSYYVDFAETLSSISLISEL